MRNQYGRHLRALVARHFSLDVTIAMHDVDAFEEQMSAYPAITVISRGRQQPAVVADTTAAFGPDNAPGLAHYVRSASRRHSPPGATRHPACPIGSPATSRGRPAVLPGWR